MKNKKLWWSIGGVLCALVIVAVSLITYFVLRDKNAWNKPLTVAAAQVGETQTIKVDWAKEDSIDSVSIVVKHGDDVVYEETITDKDEIAKNTKDVPAFFGKHQVEVTAKANVYGKERVAKKTTTVALSASEYNILPLVATMPVTMISFKLDEITKNNTIPTFIYLERGWSMDYSVLPEGTELVPVANKTTVNEFTELTELNTITANWIKELYEINNNSKFHLYYNDYWLYGALQATVANGIPKSNYNLVLLSDGAATFNLFNQQFNVETTEAHARYEALKTQYNTLLAEIAERGSYNRFDTSFVISADDSRKLAYVMVREESNVEWWVTGVDNRAIAPTNAEIFNEFKELSTEEGGNKIKIINFSNLFNSLDADGIAYMKRLFKLGDNLFADANAQNKQAMVILGSHDYRASRPATNEVNFELYVRATKAYYGDKYVYYYKGHPATPADTIPEKAKELADLGLIDLPSAIPAEMIALYNPDLVYIGYSSSTFKSTTDDQSAGVWNQTESGFTQEYKNHLETFFSLAKNTGSKYGLTVTSDNAVLIEIADKNESGEITGVSKVAVYECTYNADGTFESETLKFYQKNVSGTYELVAE